MCGSGLTGFDIGQMMSATDSPLLEGGRGRRSLDDRTRSIRRALPVPQAEERRQQVARLFGRSPNELLRHDAARMCRYVWCRCLTLVPGCGHSAKSYPRSWINSAMRSAPASVGCTWSDPMSPRSCGSSVPSGPTNSANTCAVGIPYVAAVAAKNS